MTIAIANPTDHNYIDTLYLMQADVYGDVKVYVWAESFEDAFEHLVEYLDDHAPGCLTRIDYAGAALDLGLSTQLEKLSEDEQERVRAHAEMDMSIVGHTTLINGDAIPSWEWGGDEVTNTDDWERVKTRSIEDDLTRDAHPHFDCDKDGDPS